jgi:hypothetical protein
MARSHGQRCGTEQPVLCAAALTSSQAGNGCRRAADHQNDPATIPGRITDLAKPRFQALTRQMLHHPILTGPLPSWPTHNSRLQAITDLAAAAAPSPPPSSPEHRLPRHHRPPPRTTATAYGPTSTRSADSGRRVRRPTRRDRPIRAVPTRADNAGSQRASISRSSTPSSLSQSPRRRSMMVP